MRTYWSKVKWRFYTLRWLLPPRHGASYGAPYYRRFVGVVGLWLGQGWCDFCDEQRWGVAPLGNGWLTVCRVCVSEMRKKE